MCWSFKLCAIWKLKTYRKQVNRVSTAWLIQQAPPIVYSHGSTDTPALRVTNNLVITTLAMEVDSDHYNDCFDVAAFAKSTPMTDAVTGNMNCIYSDWYWGGNWHCQRGECECHEQPCRRRWCCWWSYHSMYRVHTDDKIENWKSSRLSVNELRPQSAVVDGEMSQVRCVEAMVVPGELICDLVKWWLTFCTAAQAMQRLVNTKFIYQ